MRRSQILTRVIICVLVAGLLVPALSGASAERFTLAQDQSVPAETMASQPEVGGSSSDVRTRTASVLSLTSNIDVHGNLADWVTDSVALYDGSVYVAGYTESTDLPMTADSYSDSHSGDYDVFILHIAANKSVLAATYLGGQDNDFCMAVDYYNETDTVYVAGYTESDNETDGFPTTPGAWQESITTSNFEGFIATFTSNLSTLLYCSYFGKHFNERIFGMEVAQNGLAVCVGETSSSNLDMEGTSENSTYGGMQDGFVMIHNCTPGAGDVPYSSFVSGPGTDIACSVVIIEQNETSLIRLAIAGMTDEESFNHKFGLGAYSSSFTESGFTHWLLYQNFTGFSAEVDYGTFLGEGGLTNITYDFPKIAMDSTLGAVVVVASVTSDWPTAGTVPQNIFGGGTRDSWIAWVDSDGGGGASDLIAATYWGGSRSEHAMDVMVAPNNGYVLVAGSTTSGNAPTAGLRSVGQEDTRCAWVARYPRPSGRRTSLNYSTMILSGGTSEFWTIVADPRTDYPLCSGVETESDTVTAQDIINYEIVLPTEPILRVVDAPAEGEIKNVGDRIKVSAVVDRGSTLTGSQIDSVSLVLVFVNESTRFIAAEDRSGALYSVDTQINDTESDLESWYFLAVSRDNGQSYVWANATANEPSEGGAPSLLGITLPSLVDIWGSYGVYIVIAILTVVALLLSLRGQPSVLGTTVAIVGMVALTWLYYLNVPGTWEPSRVIPTFLFVAAWANLSTISPLVTGMKLPQRRAIPLGAGIAFTILIIVLIVTPPALGTLGLVTAYVVFASMAVGGFAGAFPSVKALIVTGVAWIASALLAAIPAVASAVFGLFGVGG